MAKVTIGIDPGKEGAAALLSDNRWPEITPLPWTANELGLHALYSALIRFIEPHDQVHICLEKVGARPGQGVVSMFNFGEGYGELKGMLKLMQYPYTLVPPQTWKKHVLAGTDKSKGATAAWAIRTFPKLEKVLAKKSGLLHMGKVDALAIAYYGHHYLKR